MFDTQLIQDTKLLVKKSGNIGKSRTGKYNIFALEFLKLFEKYNISLIPNVVLQDFIWCILINDIPKCKYCQHPLYNYGISGPKQLYCNTYCYHKDPIANKNLSMLKANLYKDPLWKDAVESKRKTTCLRNYGVEYPMQNPSSFEKQKISSFQVKLYNGMMLQGNEPIALDYFNMFNYTIQSGSEYLKETGIQLQCVDIENKIHLTFPDFFIKELAGFVEVKGTYTRQKDDYKIIETAKCCRLLNLAYYVMTITPKKLIHFECMNIIDVGD